MALETARASASPPRRLSMDLDFPGLRMLHPDPPIYAIDHFLSSAECDMLIKQAPPLLEDSKIGFKVSDVRTSRTGFLSRDALESRAIFERIRRLTGCSPKACEDVQVAKYTPGQYYQGHYDGADPHDPDAEAFFRGGGQRLGTVLIYLNTLSNVGGKTRFELLDLEISPEKGRAIVFFPGFTDGRQDQKLYHEATATSATKWVSQVWIRQVPDPCRELPKEWRQALGDSWS